jgi:hypothetical protein
VRNGPMVHRRAQVSRLSFGTLTPLERLASLAPLGTSRSISRRAGLGSGEPSAWEPPRISLGSRLPINLRQSLADQLGAGVRVENDCIVALGSRSGESLMRDLARAIRRYSAERAREAWTECAVGTERLEHEFFGPEADERCPVVLCLRCVAFGTGALEQHCGPDCLAVDLSSAVHAERIERGPVAHPVDAMCRAVEYFRNARKAASRPHYDLDCFIAGGQMIFTWRPVPTPARR